MRQDAQRRDRRERASGPIANGQRATGRVVRKNTDKGYFFIKGDHDQQDYFAHMTALTDGATLQDLTETVTRVEYTARMTEKGPRAEQVTLL